MNLRMTKVAPTLVVEKIEPTLEFFIESLGFKKEMDVPGEHGLIFAMVVHGAIEIHMQTKESVTKDIPYLKECSIPSSSFLYIDVEDVKSLYDQLKNSDIVVPLQKTFYGATHFFV